MGAREQRAQPGERAEHVTAACRDFEYLAEDVEQERDLGFGRLGDPRRRPGDRLATMGSPKQSLRALAGG